MSQSLAVCFTTLSVYKGTFTWNDKVLKDRIRAAHPKYNEYDPKTWPLITCTCIMDATEESSSDPNIRLPVRVAYTHHAMKKWLSQKPPVKVESFSGRVSLQLKLFRDYPLNFFEDGTLRESVGISESAYLSWEPSWGDRNLSPSPGEKVQESNEIRAETSPETAYAQVMRILGDKETASPALDTLSQELANCQAKLKESEQQYSNCKEALADQEKRITTLEGQLHASEKHIGFLKGELTKRSKELGSEIKRANSAEQHVVALTNKLMETETQLEAARKETEDANKRVMNIWAKVKNVQGSEAGAADTPSTKRATSGLSDEERRAKRARVEDAEDGGD
jgi:hypothetical protein